MISVFILDDHTLFREGLKGLLKTYDSIHIAGDCGKANASPEQIETCRPDMVLIGQRKDDAKAFELSAVLSSSPYYYRILVVGESSRSQNMFNLFNAGVLGYVSKDAPIEILIRSIVRVSSGEYSFPQEASDILMPLIQKSKQKGKKKGTSELSVREKEILCFMAEGFRNKQIAERLKISPRTVEVHKAHIFKKLNTSNIADIIRYAIDNNICAIS